MDSWVIVTGANRGIGLALTTLYKNRGSKVMAVCRQSSKELEDLGVQVIENVDVREYESMKHVVNGLQGFPVSLLINNSGVLRRDSLKALDFDEAALQFDVNALGPLRVTTALLPFMITGGPIVGKASSKIVIISSRMGSVSDNSSGNMYGYRMSKSAANMAGKSLALDLSADGIAVGVLHPGFVRTGMTGGAGMIDTKESATGLVARIDELSLDNTGSFWHTNGELLQW